MQPQFICDTNVVSELMRPTPQPQVEDWLNTQTHIYFSAISVEEIRFGLIRKNLQKKSIWFERFLSVKVTILEVNGTIADRSGTIRAKLGLEGHTRSQADMLIAATAWAHNLKLATRNTKDFEGTGVLTFNPFEGS